MSVCLYVCMYVCLYVYQKLLNTTLSDLEILHTYSLYTKNANEGGILFLANRKWLKPTDDVIGGIENFFAKHGHVIYRWKGN